MTAEGARAGSRLAAGLVVVVLLAAALVGVVAPRADAQAPVQVTLNIKGCAITPGTTLPIDGQFVCPDSMYTSGNLGSNWSELDLVPYRLIAENRGPTQTYTIAVAGDAEDDGIPGFDAVSVPQLNPGLSDSSCQEPVAVGEPQIRRPGQGGRDASIYRNVTISQVAGQTCVYDFTLRLALGSSGFSGGSLHGHYGSENFTSSNQSVGLQAGAIAPQGLSKTIQAARGDGFLWTVTKSSIPAQVSVDTCLPNPTARFINTITWTRTPVTGDVTWVSTVFATNPSNRPLLIRVTDVVSADGVQVDTTTGSLALLPAGAVDHPVLTHSGTAPPGTTTVTDVATATYLDAELQIPIPQTTTASASTGVVVSPPGNATAEITDVTTIDGAPISVDAVRSDTNPGTLDTPLGEPGPGPITWESGTVSGSGRASLEFTAHFGDEFAGDVTVSDVATLEGSDGASATGSSSATVHGQPAAPTITFVKTVDVPPTQDADFRFGLWFFGQDPGTDPPIISGPVTIPAGSTQSETIAISVPPSPDGYTYVEEPAPGYVGLGDGFVDPLDVCDEFVGSVANERLTGTIAITKVVEGDPAGSDPTATVVVDCPGADYDETLVVPQGSTEQTSGIPTGLECTISEPNPPPGWDVSIEPDTVTIEEGDPVEVTVTNTRQVGQLVVTKVIEGEVAGASTTFPVTVDCDVDDYDAAFDLTVPDGETQVSSEPLDIPVGVTCTVSEESVPAGWGLDSVTPDGGAVTIDEGTSEVVLTNTRLTGSLVVTKQAVGDPAGAPTVFTIDVTCDNGFSEDLILAVGDAGAASQALDGIPTGVECTVSEPAPPDGWTLAEIVPEQPVEIGADPDLPVAVTVTNDRDLGTIAVEKVVVGPTAGSDPTATVEVDCPGDTYDQTLVVPPGETVESDGIPTGLDCTIAEPNPPPGWDVTVDPDTVTVAPGPPAQVTVTNTRQTGEITVVKQLRGPVAGADTEFALELDCDGEAFDQEVTLDVTDGDSASATVEGIPVDTVCRLTEPQTAEGWRLVRITPGQVVVGDEPVQMVAVNRRETGGLEIYKHLLGPVAGAPTTFSAFLNCDGTAYDQDVVIEVRNGVTARAVVRGIPTGVTCTAEEVSIPPQWSLGGVVEDTVTIADTELITVQAVNTRVTGDVIVRKAVGGEPHDGTSFDLELNCGGDLFDTAVPVDVGADESLVQEHFSGIPTGVRCAVTESALPFGWRLESITPGQVEITDAQPSVLTVTNTHVPPLAATGSAFSLTELVAMLLMAAGGAAAGVVMVVYSVRVRSRRMLADPDDSA